MPAMNSPPPERHHYSHKKSPSFWKTILIVIIFVFGVVILFGAMVYVFVAGAQQLGLAAWMQTVILVVMSGLFAWLLKRLSDTVAGLSHHWFPEERQNDRRRQDKL
jgi:divalent metal cation (Fe/Co/Zn/Cd) transporter